MGLKETVTDALFSYETEKIVQVPSYKVGVIYRLIQLAIVLYVLIVVIIKDKGYQDKFPASGDCFLIKMKLFTIVKHLMIEKQM